MTLPGDIARTEFRLVATYQVGDTLILVASHTVCLVPATIFASETSSAEHTLGTCSLCRCCVIAAFGLHCQIAGLGVHSA